MSFRKSSYSVHRAAVCALMLLSVSSVKVALAQTAPTADELFNWVERSFQGFFPPGPTTQRIANYMIRAYPSGHYLGVAGGRVYVLGPATNQEVKDIGALADFTCLVTPLAVGCAGAAPLTQRKLTDTGIFSSQCFQSGSNTFVNCSATTAIAKQDGMLGRDATHPDHADGSFGLSYSRVEGRSLNECVKDNITGLTWEGKTADGGLRDWQKTYTHHGDSRVGDASAYVRDVNAQALCGYQDWRLPSISELQSLMNLGTSGGPDFSYIDVNWFPAAQRTYWTGSAYSGDNNPYYVDFRYAGITTTIRSARVAVRLVRGPAWDGAAQYRASADGSEVTDSSTGLTWKRCAEGMNWTGSTCAGTPTGMTHETALTTATQQQNWRLPNIKELVSIMDHTGTRPAINTTVFMNAPVDYFWSSTPYVNGVYADSAWFVHVDGGLVGASGRGNRFFVRLVRE